jgi:CheY-like chemotaxis protein
MRQLPKLLHLDDEMEEQTTESGGLMTYVKEYLNSLGVVACEFTAQLADATAKICDECYDVLILDIRIRPEYGGGKDELANTPWDRTGSELIRLIRSEGISGKTPSNVPIIVLTALMHTPTREQILQVGREAAGPDETGEPGCFIRIIDKPPRLADIGKTVLDALHWRKGPDHDQPSRS